VELSCTANSLPEKARIEPLSGEPHIDIMANAGAFSTRIQRGRIFAR
jgi:hypothetical protein